MDDVKDKMKGFVKKVNNTFSSSSSSSSSGKFKGQGRVLGSSSSVPTNPIHSRPSPSNPPPKTPSSSSASVVSSNPRTSNSNQITSKDHQKVQNTEKAPPSNGFNPFDSMISPAGAKQPQNGYTVNVFECPVCARSFRSEEEVSEHIDGCLGNSANANDAENVAIELPENELRSNLESCVGAFVSGGASEGSIEVFLRLIRNVVKEPENAKFRRIRMSNPKIREAVGEVVGGVELLECVGFGLKEEDGEMWAVMDAPSDDQILLLKEAILLLDSQGAKSLPLKDLRVASEPVEPSLKDVSGAREPMVSEPVEPSSKDVSGAREPMVEPRKIDRQVKVFFSVPESIAARIVLPESFYNLSVDELKREADLRKKKMAESQLLIPKSYKEKQAKASRKKYKNAVIRIQFPDGVVLQGIFLPWEPTSSLYEFVSSSLKEPCLEFELWHPAVIKRRMIPRFSGAGEKTPTLDEEDLVPAALVKFKPIETDSIVFTGLSNELLELSEPLN